MASVHQKQPVPNVAVSSGSLPVIFSEAIDGEFVIELVNDIDLLGFSGCAHEGENNEYEKAAAIKPSTGEKVSNIRLDITRILMQN